MSRQPRDGSTEDGLCAALLRFVEDDRIPELRQALSGFNHRCRNTLNSMKMGFYLTRRAATDPLPERWEEMNRTYEGVEGLFELIQTIYRTMALTTVRQTFQAVVDERGAGWRAAFQREGATLAIRPPAREDAGEFDATRIASAFDGFVAWRASRLGSGGQAILSWGTTRRRFELSWHELPSTAATARGGGGESRCPAAALAATTRSLALPLLARVVAEHRGRLSWTPGPPAEARIRWPLTVTADPPSPRRPPAVATNLQRPATLP